MWLPGRYRSNEIRTCSTECSRIKWRASNGKVEAAAAALGSGSGNKVLRLQKAIFGVFLAI